MEMVTSWFCYCEFRSMVVISINVDFSQSARLINLMSKDGSGNMFNNLQFWNLSNGYCFAA